MVRLVRLQAPVAFGDPALHASAGSWHLRCHLRFEASGRACGVNLSLSGLVSEVGLLRDVSNAKDRDRLEVYQRPDGMLDTSSEHQCSELLIKLVVTGPRCQGGIRHLTRLSAAIKACTRSRTMLSKVMQPLYGKGREIQA